MEKRKPHYSLAELQAIVARQGLLAFTRTAIFNAMMMGLTETEALEVIANMTGAMFYKSMTTHRDATIWQDVYHAPCPNGKTAYVKLTMQDGAVVIQFKEK